jgi:predicted RNA-binding Zn ribbon-like protein
MDRDLLIRGEGHPGGRAPAPAPLRRVQDLVNSVDRENGPDALDDPTEWLAFRGLATARSAAEVARMIETREALRTLLLRDGGAHAAYAVLTAVAERGRLVPDFAAGSLRARAKGVDGALAEIAGVAFLALADGSWPRLKACPRSVCGWAFYDRSPNGGATWCAMELCGNREKVAAHYRRSRSGRAGSASASGRA